MGIVIWHNPACGTSRNALALIHHAGIEPQVVDYLKTPPTRDALATVVTRMGVPLRSIVREKGTPHGELGLADPDLTDDRLLDAMIAHPILINRPIVLTPLGVKLCRPSDMVLDLLPEVAIPDFVKDDGEPALRDRPVAGDDPALVEALAAAGLPTDDLAETGRTFFACSTLSGRLVGHAGFEIHGEDTLLRSLVVVPDARGRGFGGAIVARLLRRAFDRGGRRAWALTTSVGDWLERKGFTRVERHTAPAAILATRQVQSLCPGSAGLFARPIRL